MVALVAQGMVELAPLKSRLVLGIRRFPLPAERGKLFPPPFANCLNQAWICMTHKVLKRGRLTILLAHKQEREKRRQEDCASCQFEPFKRGQLAQALTQHAVTDLIM